MWWLWAVAQGARDRSRSNLRVEVEWEKAWGGLERGLESFVSAAGPHCMFG